jgi:hypothetical protein
MPRLRKYELIVTCILPDCGLLFMRSCKDRPNRRFCSRDCYRLAMRKYETVAYPQIWHNGKLEYLHRVIYCEANNLKIEDIKDAIIHHKDENAFNRHPDNLEKLEGRAAHLHVHNYHKRGTWQADNDIPF